MAACEPGNTFDFSTPDDVACLTNSTGGPSESDIGQPRPVATALHPWAKFLPERRELVREGLETGDVVLSALPEGAVIERKTPNDMANSIGASRERFEKELKRGRYVGRMIVVIEGTLTDVCAASRGRGEGG